MQYPQLINATQGHRYKLDGRDVIALESSPTPRIAYIDPVWNWLGERSVCDAADLVPQPMRYFHGDTPR